MNSSLYTYALVKSIYEQKRDYIDTFGPFVLRIIKESDQSPVGLDYIQKAIDKRYFINIPLYSLGCIITRLKRSDLLEQKDKEVTLKENGSAYLSSFETEDEVSRRVNGLLENIKLYFQNNCKSSISTKEIYENLQVFVFRNIQPILDFFNASQVRKVTQKGSYSFFEKNLIGYLEKIEQSDFTHYNVFRELVYGAIICAAASCQDIDKLNEKFSKIDVFLDSNFLLSLLELDHDEVNKPISELHELLLDYGFNLKVFDFTIAQVKSVLSGYEREYQNYMPGIKVSTIYSSMRAKGFSIQDVKELISNLEDQLEAISIDIYPSSIELWNYKPDSDLLAKLQFIKTQRRQGIPSPLSLKHDLAAIDEIKKKRDMRTISKLEHSEAFFLTSDLKLAKFNLQEYGHQETLSISEVIPDRLLTNILWLRNPTKGRDLPLKSVIAAHSKNLFVDRDVWERFRKTVEKMKLSGEIENKDISLLFYNNRIKEDLLDVRETDDVNEVFIQSNLEKFKRTDKLQEKAGKAKLLKEFDKRIGNKIQRTLTDQETKRKARIWGKCTFWAKKISGVLTLIMVIVIIAIFCILLYRLFLIVKRQLSNELFNSLPNFVPILVQFVLGVITLIVGNKIKFMRFVLKFRKKIREKLSTYLSKKLYKFFK